ncbi:unnamed protein product [Linum trigynum]|uniref:Uncharacterized protein n=1 Tax=Linum trigynum TaxID=586398 RepID=A0AAV2F3Z6_9ROSI
MHHHHPSSSFKTLPIAIGSQLVIVAIKASIDHVESLRRAEASIDRGGINREEGGGGTVTQRKRRLTGGNPEPNDGALLLLLLTERGGFGERWANSVAAQICLSLLSCFGKKKSLTLLESGDFKLPPSPIPSSHRSFWISSRQIEIVGI